MDRLVTIYKEPEPEKVPAVELALLLSATEDAVLVVDEISDFVLLKISTNGVYRVGGVGSIAIPVDSKGRILLVDEGA